MDILISNSSPEPIYAQIEGQIKTLIMQNKIKDGEALPSIRVLAKELRISIITTKRAYEELEKCGFICTVAGKGSFVAPKNLELLKEENLKEIEVLLEKVANLAQLCEMPYSELCNMLDILYKGE